jgi:hypothetical protein
LGQVFKFVWRLCWKINVVCMSLSPFVSFQARLVIYLLNFPRTYPKKHRPSWDANLSLACQEIPHILRNPKVYYHIHKCRPPVFFLSQICSDIDLTIIFLEIHLNTIRPSVFDS